MLIRSQNKMELVKFDDLGIVENEYDNGVTINLYYHEEHFNIGKYSSKEKALKVLDMIQQCYQDEEYTQDWWNGMCTVPFKIKNNKVFQMPPDEEV